MDTFKEEQVWKSINEILERLMRAETAQRRMWEVAMEMAKESKNSDKVMEQLKNVAEILDGKHL